MDRPTLAAASAHVHRHPTALDKHARACLKRQRPAVLWMTGLSGSGKSTIANLLEHRLHARGCHTYLLDGDNVRQGMNRDLGFSDADRTENNRRVAETARLMVDAGLFVITALISPFRTDRALARSLFEAGEFIEVFVHAPLELAQLRDPKGLYQRARTGEIAQFTGISSRYEPPACPELMLDTSVLSALDAAVRLEHWLERNNRLPA